MWFCPVNGLYHVMVRFSGFLLPSAVSVRPAAAAPATRTMYAYIHRASWRPPSLLSVCWRQTLVLVLWFAVSRPPCSGYSLTRVMCLHTRLEMKFLRWLVVLMTYLCVPGFGSKCCDSSVCSDLGDKRRILVGAQQETCRSRSIWWSRRVDLIIVGIILSPVFVDRMCNHKVRLMWSIAHSCNICCKQIKCPCGSFQTGVHSVQVPDALWGPRSQRYAQQWTPTSHSSGHLGPRRQEHSKQRGAALLLNGALPLGQTARPQTQTHKSFRLLSGGRRLLRGPFPSPGPQAAEQ